ncbi:hypothetical protein BH10BAC3_BH10BAC3_24220 [soil metagenome]
METDSSFSNAQVSVIIPCYNHGYYLSKAIESVQSQQYPGIEIIVVDDGSKDNTKQVSNGYQNVKYIYQQNQGLSAARNTGINNSSGKYLVFLDADDWLLENAIKINLKYLAANPKVAFVSGAHLKFLEDKNTYEEKKIIVNEDHYQHFLKGNYVAMHATVMYQRWIFDQFKFDTSLRALEDYDMYLEISRHYEVMHHQELIAAYRIHDSNMSGNIPLMLNSALTSLKNQEPLLKNVAEKICYNDGVNYWKAYYIGILYRNLAKLPWGVIKNKKIELNMLFANSKILFAKLLLKKLLHVV